MLDYQSDAGVSQRTTTGLLWQAISGRLLSADLLDWPPDLFAPTSLMLQRSGASRPMTCAPTVTRTRAFWLCLRWPPGCN
jgi:hypothetical protein